MGPVRFRALPLPIVQLSLSTVLRCGQSFRWSVHPLAPSEAAELALPSHEYRMCLRDRVVCLQQTADTLFYRSIFASPPSSPEQLERREAETLAWINDYFQLNIDLEKLYDLWATQDSIFAGICGRFRGIRMLRQDPWETLISFICSSNNNISRITKMVQNICKHFSPPLLSLPEHSDPGELLVYHPFPPPSALAQPGVTANLRALGFGYRADYIQRTAQILVETHGRSPRAPGSVEATEEWLLSLRSRPTAEAREELMKLVGVGRKVADCVLLMSLDKREVVPVDTHVHQIAVKHYGFKTTTRGKANMTAKLYEDVNTKFRAVWGDYAGWAHSVLFAADLKIFAVPESKLQISAPPLTPRPKRNVMEVAVEDMAVGADTNTSSDTQAARVKKRRRAGVDMEHSHAVKSNYVIH